MTPLHLAVLNKREYSPGIVLLLLEKGAHFYQSDFDEYPLLYWALKKNNESAQAIVRLLMEKGADISLKVGIKPY